MANYGQRAIPILMDCFKQESHWLIRESIFAVINEINSPELILELCLCTLEGDELSMALTAINNLGQLRGTIYENHAIKILVELSNSETVQIRVQVAKTLRIFDDVKAHTALAKLRQDTNYRVVGAILDGII